MEDTPGYDINVKAKSRNRKIFELFIYVLPMTWY